MAFSGIDGVTDFEHGVNARTTFGQPGIDIFWPGRCRLRFDEISPGGSCVVTGDTVELPGLRAAFLDARHLLIEGPCRVEKCGAELAVRQSGTRLLLGVAATFDQALLDADLASAMEARRRWLQGLVLPGGMPARTRQTLVKACSVLKTQVYTPEGRFHCRWTTPDRWPHRRLWLWDSAFHAIGWRHIDPGLAREAVSAVLDTQRADGFIAHMSSPGAQSAITQPPVLSLAAQRLHATAPDADWIREIYPRLAAYVRWDLANRDTDGAGLVEWDIEGNPLCRSGESGMDNSPRFDQATQLDAVDFNAFLAHECEILAEFADLLNLPEEAAGWRAGHARLCSLIQQRLWSESSGLYVDYDVSRNAPSPVLASSGFLPLLCGAPTPAQARRLAAHLRDPATFGTALPVPSIAACDTEHYAKDMWRGPVWINVNWLIAEGLERYGLQADAAALRARTLAAIEDGCARFGTLFEFFDDRCEVDPPQLLRKGSCNPDPDGPVSNFVIHDYGWTASLYVDLVWRTFVR